MDDVVVNLDEAAQRLYALPPEDFTATRDDLAKQADPGVRKAVKALRKPTVPAYVVNRLVRERPDEVDSLLALGGQMREAMSSGDDLRRLTEQRRRAVADLVSVAATAAGRTLPSAVEDEVAATLEAGTADPRLADAVRSGRLVKPLRYAGFGVFPDLDDVLATALGPSARPATAGAASAPTPTMAAERSPTRSAGPAPRTGRPSARTELGPTRDSTATSRDSARDVEMAGLRAHVMELSAAAADAERSYDASVHAVRQARQALQDAERERTAAHRQVTAARKEADKARRQLGRLERS